LGKEFRLVEIKKILHSTKETSSNG
jgi:hypothetical protein